jgi:hypothetical protein
MAKSIGDVTSIKVKASGTIPYQCKTIEVELDFKFWVFDCGEPLFCPKYCEREF